MLRHLLLGGLLCANSASAGECRIIFDNWSEDVFGDLYFQIEKAPGSEIYGDYLPLADLGQNDPEIGPGYYYESVYDFSSAFGGPGIYDAGFYQLVDGKYEFVTRMDKPKVEIDEEGNCDFYYEWNGVTDARQVTFKIYLANDLTPTERDYFLLNEVTHSFGNDEILDWQTTPMTTGQDDKGTFLVRTVPFVSPNIYEWNFKVAGQYLGTYWEANFGTSLQFSVSNSGHVEYQGEFIDTPIEVFLNKRNLTNQVNLVISDETALTGPLYIQTSFGNGWKGFDEAECKAHAICADLLDYYSDKCELTSAYQCLKEKHDLKDTLPEFTELNRNQDGTYSFTATNPLLGGVATGEWTIYRVVDHRIEWLLTDKVDQDENLVVTVGPDGTSGDLQYTIKKPVTVDLSLASESDLGEVILLTAGFTSPRWEVSIPLKRSGTPGQYLYIASSVAIVPGENGKAWEWGISSTSGDWLLEKNTTAEMVITYQDEGKTIDLTL